MEIQSGDDQSAGQGPTDKFAGRVWVTTLRASPPEGGLGIYLVSFEPGGRTHWHIHPGEQALYVISGQGRVQKSGEAPATIQPGDTVHIAPGEVHWHGATPESSMVHLAVTTAGPTEWLEPVKDEQYN